jgi:hypothetical protein
MNGRYGQVLAVVGPQTCQDPRRTQQWSRRPTAYGLSRCIGTLYALDHIGPKLAKLPQGATSFQPIVFVMFLLLFLSGM